MRTGRIENWQLVELFGETRLTGNVYECDTFEEGEEFISSPVVKYHPGITGQIAETRSGSMYQLGAPAERIRDVADIFAEAVAGEMN